MSKMWLDRLAGQPNSQSRSYSPLPRRSTLNPQSGPPRPGFNPRSSSLSLVSNDSTTSLLGISKKPNGTGLKHPSTASDHPEPLELLNKLLRFEISDPKDTSAFTRGLHSTNDVEIEEDVHVDFNGLSLVEFARSEIIESENLYVYRSQSVEGYEKDKAKFDGLHRSIRACDDVLNSVQMNLTNFQNDLGAVSAEIETLQARSTALSRRLENRKVVENGLGPIIEEITISPAVIMKISEGSIDEGWIRALSEVDKRTKVLDQTSKERRNIKGIKDLRPLLESLVNKALERIRDYLVNQIKALRSPSINAQIIQQQNFLRYKDIYAFLRRHHEKLAEEIGQAYLNTMRWYFLNKFTLYEKALEKLKLHIFDRNDILGQDDGSRKPNILGSKSGPSHDAFGLGRRIDILRNSSQAAISTYLAEEDTAAHYLEFPFWNFNVALIDNASAEYLFLTAFFSPSLPLSTISRQFNYIFEPTFALGLSLTRSLVGETTDCLGILLCVRINQRLAFELQRRRTPTVDSYVNGTRMLLWPRFQVIMDLHCESIRKAASILSSQSPSKAEQAKQSAAPHFLTQRFGQLLQGIITLSAEAGDDEPVSTSLVRLRGETEAFLTKLSRGIIDPRKRQRFLYNNYSLILTIIGDLDSKLAREQREHFEALKSALGDGA